MGRLTLNVLLSFAQFEREVTSERIRDKIAASKRNGMWMGGFVPLGYGIKQRQLVVVESVATTVRHIFQRYCEVGSGKLALRAEATCFGGCLASSRPSFSRCATPLSMLAGVGGRPSCSCWC